MSIYFIETSTGRYELNATKSVSKTLTGKLTDNPVESGASLSDHYVQFPNTFNLDGIITDISSLGRDATLEREGRRAKDVIDEFTKVKNNRQTFTFYYGDVISAALNCMFESITLTQDKINGSSRGLNSFKFKAKFRQVNFAQKALQTNERATAFEDKYDEEKESSETTTSLSTVEAGLKLQEEAIARITSGGNRLLFNGEG